MIVVYLWKWTCNAMSWRGWEMGCRLGVAEAPVSLRGGLCFGVLCFVACYCFTGTYRSILFLAIMSGGNTLCLVWVSDCNLLVFLFLYFGARYLCINDFIWYSVLVILFYTSCTRWITGGNMSSILSCSKKKNVMSYLLSCFFLPHFSF